jgi:cytoskeletal protein CcmA (bactofilin family)
MFRRREELTEVQSEGVVERVTSVLGDGTNLTGRLTGRGGVRIEGTFEGEIALNGLLVIGTTGRVTCDHVQANTVIVAGALRGNISADKVEIRSTGRVWGNVTTGAFTTEEGAFLRGQIQMEEQTGLEHPKEDKEVVASEIILRPETPVQIDKVDIPEKGEEKEAKPAPKSKPKATKAKSKAAKAKKKAKPKRATKAKSK